MKLIKIPCSICGSISSQLFAKAWSAYLNDYLSIVRCTECSFVYVNPREQEDIWVERYSSEYIPSEYFQKEDENSNILTHTILDEISIYKRTGKLLDIGCYAGALLMKARDKGWDTAGLEANKSAASYARNIKHLNIINKPVGEGVLPDGEFDIITMIQVLEHMPRPADTIKIVSRALKKNGFLVIEVPNLLNLSFRLHKWLKIQDRAKTLDPGGHLSYFTLKTLSTCLLRSGFEPIQVHSGFNKRLISALLSKRGMKFIAPPVAGLLHIVSEYLRIGFAIRIIARKS